MNPQSSIPVPIILSSKDVSILTGLGLRASQKLLKKIRDAAEVTFVTLQLFCMATGYDENDAREILSATVR